MVLIKAFKGFRPAPEKAKQVASRPYDVLNREEAVKEVEGNPFSFLHVVRSEIDLPENTNPYSPEVYQKARENFLKLVQEKTIFQDEKEKLYVYQQVMDGHSQSGIVACSSVKDYFDDHIKKHEFTRPVKEQDRINHIKTTGIHSGPVFMTYPDLKEVDEIVNDVKKKKPEYNFTAVDGIQHTVWVIDEQEKIETIVNLFKTKIPKTYIADGHHRAASSSKVGKELAEKNPKHTGNESYNYFLSVLFPASQLKIIDYNRVVKDLNGKSLEEFIAELSNSFIVEKKGKEIFKPAQFQEFGMYLDGDWYKLSAKPGTFKENDPVESLDVSILSNNLLDPVLGIKDQRTDDRIDFIGGIRGLKELQKRVDSGEMKVAFALFPVSIQQLMDIADSGNVMPPKSTWFEPKLRSGLVVHQFSENS